MLLSLRSAFRKSTQFFKLISIYFEEEFEKFKKNFALIQMALTFASPMKKGEAVKPEDL